MLHPEFERKLESLANKFPALTTMKFSDAELQGCYHDKVLAENRGRRNYIVFYVDEATSEEKKEALFRHLEKTAIEYRHLHPLDLYKAVYLHFHHNLSNGG